MSFYFSVLTGLRGCYMPDTAGTVRVDTRRELRDYLNCESSYIREGYKFGGSRREVARVAAEVWRQRRKSTLDYVIPFGDKPGARPFGIFVSPATRRDYLDYRAQGDF